MRIGVTLGDPSGIGPEIVLAACATLVGAPPSSAAREALIRLTATQRVALLGLLAALAWTAGATLVAPRRAIAFDGARTVTLLTMALPLGASRALAGRRRVGLFVVLALVTYFPELSLWVPRLFGYE